MIMIIDAKEREGRKKANKEGRKGGRDLLI